MKTLEEFVKKYPTKTYQAKEIILHQGAKVPCVYCIVSGTVKMYDISTAGEEKPLSYDTKGEAFPIAWMYGKAKTSLYFYEAYDTCTVALIPREELMDFIKSDPDVMFNTLNNIVERYMDFSSRINGLAEVRARDKVLHALTYFGRRYGHPSGKDQTTIPKPPAQHELANFVGLTRETVSTILSKLRKQKIISYGHKKPLKIDKKKIKKEL